VGTLKRLEFGLTLLREIAQSEVVKEVRRRAIEVVSERVQEIAASERLPSLVSGAAGLIGVLLGPGREEQCCDCTGCSTQETAPEAAPEEKAAAKRSSDEEPMSVPSTSVFEDPELKQKMEEFDASSEAGADSEDAPESGVQLSSKEGRAEASSAAVDECAKEPVADASEAVRQSEEPVGSDRVEVKAEPVVEEAGAAVVSEQKPMGRAQGRSGGGSSPKTRNSQNKSSSRAKKTADKSSRKK
jgi:hypothetical protein